MQRLGEYKRLLLGCGVVLSGLLYALGLTQPIMVLTRYHVWESHYSVAGVINTLRLDGQAFLAYALLVPAVILPVARYYMLFMLACMPSTTVARNGRFFHRLDWVAAWSMFDVLLLAVIIFLVKQKGAYNPELLFGVYCFVGGVGLALLIQRFITLPEDDTHAPHQYVWYAAYTLLVCCILGGAVLLYLGITQFIVRFSVRYISTLGYLEQEYSVLGLMQVLWAKGNTFLWGVLLVFSILFPLAKLIFLTVCVALPHALARHRWLVRAVEWCGRYSMTDIMILALMVSYVSFNGYTESTVLPGTHYFTASVVVTMLGYAAVHVLLRAARAGDVPYIPKERDAWVDMPRAVSLALLNRFPKAAWSALFLAVLLPTVWVGRESVLYHERVVHRAHLYAELSTSLDWIGEWKGNGEFALRCQAEAVVRIRRLQHTRGTKPIGGTGVVSLVLYETDKAAAKLSTTTRERIIRDALAQAVARFPRYTPGCNWPTHLEHQLVDYSSTRTKNVVNPRALSHVPCATIPKDGNMFLYCSGDEYRRGVKNFHKGWW